MIEAETFTAQSVPIVMLGADFAARSKPCDNCGRKIAIAYKYLKGRYMRVCGECLAFPQLVQ